MATEGYTNAYLAQIEAARKAARKRAGLPDEDQETGSDALSGALADPSGFSGLSLKIPAGLVGTTGNKDLDDALQGQASAEDFSDAAGVGEDARKKAAGDPGFLSTALGYLIRPRSAVVGGLTGLLGLDDEDGDATNDSAGDRIRAAISGDRTYGTGDFGALKWDEDDGFGMKALKGTGAFLGDTLLDPLTYVGGVGIAGRAGKEIAGQGVKALDQGLIDDALKASAGTTATAGSAQAGAGAAGAAAQSSAAQAAGAAGSLAAPRVAGTTGGLTAGTAGTSQASASAARRRLSDYADAELIDEVPTGARAIEDVIDVPFSPTPELTAGPRALPGPVGTDLVLPSAAQSVSTGSPFNLSTVGARPGSAAAPVTNAVTPNGPINIGPIQATVIPRAGAAATPAPAAVQSAISAAVPNASDALRAKLSVAAEEGFFLRRGRGVRQALVATLKSEGIADDVAEELGTRMFNSLDQGIRGGVGIQGLIGRGIAFTPGGGQLTDALGLGKVADKAFDLRNGLRTGNIASDGLVRGGLSQASQGLTARLGGRDGGDLARYLRGETDETGKVFSYEDFVKTRDARNVRRESLTGQGIAGAARLQAANQVVQSLGRDRADEVRAAVRDVWAGGGQTLAQDVREKAEQATKLLDDGIRNLGDEFRTLAEDTGFFTPEQAAEFLKNQVYQPRVLTPETKRTFAKNKKNATGVQTDMDFTPTKKRSGVYMKEDPTKVGQLDADGNKFMIPMNNREANAAAAGEGKDTRFIEDPFDAFDEYANAIGYSISRLQQVKSLTDSGLVRRLPNKNQAFTEKLADGTDQRYVSLGGGSIKGKSLSSATKDLWVPAYAKDALDNLLSTNIEKSNAFIDNVYKPFYSFFKTTATVGRGPGYHIRNGIGAGWQNYVNGVGAANHTAMATIMRTESDARTPLRNFLAGSTGRFTGARKQEFQDLPADLQAILVAKAGGSAPADLSKLTTLDLDELVDQAMAARLSGNVLKTRGSRPNLNLYQAWAGMKAQGLGRDNTLLQDTSADALGAGNLTRGLDQPTLFTGTRSQDRNAAQRGADKLVQNPYISFNVNTAQSMETYFRGAAYLEGARRFGLDNDGITADLFSKSLHFDYDNLSDTERRVIKNVIPFYTFMRNNAPQQFQQLVMQPGRFNTLATSQYEAANQFGEKNADGSDSDRNAQLPNWVRERMGFLTEFGGDSPIALMAESPATDLNKLINGDPLRFGGPVDFNEILNSANPLLKTPIEALAQKDLNTGASLDRQVAAPWYLGGSLSPLSRNTNDEGQATVDARIPSAIADLLPPVSVIDRLSSGAIESATGAQESKQETRSVSNRAGLLLGAPLATFDQRQQEAEARNRATIMDRFTKQDLLNRGVDAQEIELLRELARTPGYQDSYIAMQLQSMMSSPIQPQ